MFWILSLLACGTNQLDPDVQRIVDEVLVPSGFTEEDTLLYEVGHLSRGETVRPLLTMDGVEADPVAMNEPTTLYFVDLLPDAHFDHPVVFVFLDDDGDLHVQEEAWFPIVNEEPFVPELHDAVWGLNGEADDIASFDEDEWLASEYAYQLPDNRSDHVDEACNPSGTEDHAVTFTSWPSLAMFHDELNMRAALSAHGFTVQSVRPQGSDRTSGRAFIQALATLAAKPENTLDDVVIYYSGHGGKDGGWYLGADGDKWFISVSYLAGKLAAIDAERLTIVIDACYSGSFAAKLETELKEKLKKKDMEVTVVASSSSTQVSYAQKLPNLPGSFFTQKMVPLLLAQPRGEIDWSATVPAAFGAPKRPQSPNLGRIEPCIPLLYAHDVEGTCVVAHVDGQDYDRQVQLDGKWFDSTEGRVVMQADDGEWFDLSPVYWDEDDIVLHIPMRSEGFPSTGWSPDLEMALPGIYLLKVIREDGEESESYFVDIRMQVYEAVWTADFSSVDYPDFYEVWHPLTPADDWTNGGTIQASALFLSTEPGPDLENVDENIDALHTTSAGMQALPFWGYDLFPAERDLTTAYEQGFPEFNYYGFRADFGEEYRSTSVWHYLLAYD